MDKDFAKKVKSKRYRNIAIAALIVAIAIAAILALNIEKADYTQSLKDTIAEAEQLSEEAEENSGNQEGQYASYTILEFNLEIEKAKLVSNDEESAYTAKQEAYEELKDEIKDFKKNTNTDTISKDEISKIIEEGKEKEYTSSLSDDEDVTFVINPKNITKPLDINLMTQEDGPFAEDIEDYLAELGLNGQMVTFYQDGSFGGDISVNVPLEDEDMTTAQVYKFNTSDYTFEYVMEATVADQSATYNVNTGGDYIILKDKIDEEAAKEAIAKVNEEKAASGAVTPATTSTKGHKSGTTVSGGTSSSSGSSSSGSSSGGSSGGNSGNTSGGSGGNSNQGKIAVTVEIRNDTFAAKRGVIISSTTYYANEGATVFDVLIGICRDKGVNVSHKGGYIQSIGGISEFDGGDNSGWMYFVNGSSPNYGCDSFVIEEGDEISWQYTCEEGDI